MDFEVVRIKQERLAVLIKNKAATVIKRQAMAKSHPEEILNWQSLQLSVQAW